MQVWTASLIALAVLVSPVGSALAQSPDGSMAKLVGHPKGDLTTEGIFERMDENRDGKIDRAELRTRKMNVFYVRDQDQDSHLSRQEFDSLSDAVFAALDEDKDGRISGFEFNQGKLTEFETIDSNGDNAISPAEFQAFRVQIKG